MSFALTKQSFILPDTKLTSPNWSNLFRVKMIHSTIYFDECSLLFLFAFRSPLEKTRYETSLGLLTKKFVSLFHTDPTGTVDLNRASIGKFNCCIITHNPSTITQISFLFWPEKLENLPGLRIPMDPDLFLEDPDLDPADPTLTLRGM